MDVGGPLICFIGPLIHCIRESRRGRDVENGAKISLLILHRALYVPVFVVPQEIRTAQTFAAFPVHYRIHLFVAAAFSEAEKVTQDDIVSKVPMFNMLKTRPEDQRHVIAAFELLCQASILCLK